LSPSRAALGRSTRFRDLTAERGLDEQKGDLIATISHELRTPIAAVYGAAKTLHLARGLARPQKRRAMLEMIASQAMRLSQVTDDILLATQLDRGNLHIEVEPVDVGALVRATVDNVTPDAEIAVEVEGDPVEASAASDRVEQVLVNLLDNAVKYGDAPISVRVEPPAGACGSRSPTPARGSRSPSSARSSSGSIARARRSPRAGRAPDSGSTSHASSSSAWAGGSPSARIRAAGASFVVELPRVPA
jgi:signal transduction histidine kinase